MAFVRQHPKAESIAWFHGHVSSGKADFFAQLGMDFVPGRREGVYLWDVANEVRLINCHCNGGVFNLGHRHPVVVETLKRALDELDIGNHHLVSEQRAALGRRLAELAPGDLPYTVFAVGGGEAIDFALKLARAHTRRPGVVSARGGYHGHTGLGRSGKIWAIEHWADPAGNGSIVEPDILVTGKGLSGGIYPIAATCYRAELNPFMHANPFIHISTFGGAEVGCAVALAVLDLTAEPAFLNHVSELADRFASGFQQLQARYPETLVDARQLGLMIGLVFPDETCGPLMTKLLYDQGVLAIYANNDQRVLQFLPPLVMTGLEAEEVLGALDRALATLCRMRDWTVAH
jgi:acetylornithine/succinyldiaminopimelate/putrescine aminotransferase